MFLLSVQNQLQERNNAGVWRILGFCFEMTDPRFNLRLLHDLHCRMCSLQVSRKCGFFGERQMSPPTHWSGLHVLSDTLLSVYWRNAQDFVRWLFFCRSSYQSSPWAITLLSEVYSTLDTGGLLKQGNMCVHKCMVISPQLWQWWTSHIFCWIIW